MLCDVSGGQDYAQLFGLWVVAVIGIGAISPANFSLVGDLYDDKYGMMYCVCVVLTCGKASWESCERCGDFCVGWWIDRHCCIACLAEYT